MGKEKAHEIRLTSLVLSFREEEEKDVRDSKVRPEGQWISWVLEERKSGQGVRAVG